MANFDKLAPFILRYESGARIISSDSPESAFRKASAKGVVTVKGDRGGATLCGVTIGTYSDYRRSHGHLSTTEDDLARMTYLQWRDIAKGMFWDKCLADQIDHQGTANMLVDWCYTAGVGNPVAAVQRALGITADGKVGRVTINALNTGDPLDTFRLIKQSRIDYYRRVAQRGSNARFLTGWLNRTEAITLTSLIYR